MGRVPLVLALTCLATSIAGAAGADPVPSLDLRRFEPPADPRGSLYLEPADTVAAGEWNAGLFASYANRMVVIEESGGDVVATPLEHQVAMDYVASLGVLDRLALSVSVPTVVYQQGDDARGLSPDVDALPRTALGDAALGTKIELVQPGDLGGFALAALGRLTVPTGDERSYLGEGSVAGDVRLLGELKTIGIALRGSMGAHLRSDYETYFGERFGHDLPWGVGLAVRPEVFTVDPEGRWEVFAELRGAVSATPSFASGPQSPTLGGVAARYRIGDVSVLAGAEMPLTAAVGSPRVRGVLGIGWAPRFYDADGDGIPDDLDRCPELAEDRDGVEDGDGCVDFDNDRDGVPDPEDQCPMDPEDRDGYEDEDGCVDPDNDGDGVLDKVDACPDVAGVATENGCAIPDTDGDGVLDTDDWCRESPEDRDGYQDEDGCPDLDNDGDGVPDSEDSCRDEAGAQRSDPLLHGCPTPDRDGDTYDDEDDSCPTEPEDFDGVEDDDGCADTDHPPQRSQPLVTVDETGEQPSLRWREAPRVVREGGQVRVDPRSQPTLRALAQVLNEHPHWVVLVGVRPRNQSPEAQGAALTEAFAIVSELHQYTHREDVAESVGWEAVWQQPGAATGGVGLLVVTRSPPGTP
jgi:OOP family OmpA-OmpF porin